MAKKSRKQKQAEVVAPVAEIKPVVEAQPEKRCQDCGSELENKRWRVCPACLTKRHQAREAARKQAKSQA